MPLSEALDLHGPTMTQLSLFDAGDDRPPQAARLAPRLHALAEQGVYFGTSSWKYEGWLGSIYDAERYVTRGKFSQQKFEAECLAEYAATFPVVCGDFAFYQFPSPDYWKRLFGQTPASFLFGFKVPEEITVARWPRHARVRRPGRQPQRSVPRRGPLRKPVHPCPGSLCRAGRHADLRVRDLPAVDLPDCGRFPRPARPLPRGTPGWVPVQYRDPQPRVSGAAHFDLLARHGVAHVFNAWSRMPELKKQLEMPGTFTADFTVVLRPPEQGRNYEQAVQTLHPLQARPGAGPRRPGRHAEDRRAPRSGRRDRRSFSSITGSKATPRRRSSQLSRKSRRPENNSDVSANDLHPQRCHRADRGRPRLRARRRAGSGAGFGGEDLGPRQA